MFQKTLAFKFEAGTKAGKKLNGQGGN